MEEGPVPFSDSMARALLDDGKTQTRRTIKSTGVPDRPSRGQKAAGCLYAEGQKL
ncbi:hypothetical protein ACAX43_28610 [Paraburkholderia sp. IW21]|uniref:hypothetical protein n=1 Tax=Paraburkholderia sp. IW21 TaxID=3242488 RepID=UPI0035205B95